MGWWEEEEKEEEEEEEEEEERFKEGKRSCMNERRMNDAHLSTLHILSILTYIRTLLCFSVSSK